jgi:DNA-binding response OmpR family regulator
MFYIRINPMAHETILVIDDSREMLNTLDKCILAPSGFNVITAVDGAAGLEIALLQHPDLILLDMNLPRMNGLEILSTLRQTDCRTPVIFMTVYGSEQVAVEAFRLGVRDYLSKPFTCEDVEQVIDRALHEVRLERERETLNRNLVTAEAVRVTTITLSHYLNNYLTTLQGGLTLLEEALEQKLSDPDLLEIVHTSQVSALSIQAVMKVLLGVTNVKLSNYSLTTPMINIEAALCKELSQVQENTIHTKHDESSTIELL